MSFYRQTRKSSNGQPYLPWHKKHHPYCIRLRKKLEALLGGRCHFCGLSREQGVNLQFHHHNGRDWTPSKMSWAQRLIRYRREIREGSLKYLACDQSGNNCHEEQKRREPSKPVKLYDWPEKETNENEPF